MYIDERIILYNLEIKAFFISHTSYYISYMSDSPDIENSKGCSYIVQVFYCVAQINKVANK